MGMIRHGTVTLAGTTSPVILSSVIPMQGICKQLIMQADGSNANPIYVGGKTDTLSTTSFGFRIEAATGGIPPAPTFIDAVLISIADMRVIGNTNEILHVMAVYS